MKGGRLLSLMAHILNRTRLAFVILLSPLVVAGCSTQDPRQEADRAIERANEDISAHDDLYNEAREDYERSQDSVQSEETTQGAESAGEALDSMQEARSRLEEARREISSIRDLEVSSDLLQYSRALDEALESQIRAERREIAFYELLAKDPALEEDRQRAIGLLAEAEDAYDEADRAYREAAEAADSNPELVAPESG